MTLSLNLTVGAACVVFIYIQAAYQAKRFAKNKPINHWSKATIYGLFVALLTAVLMWGHWHEWREVDRWKDVPIIGVITRVAWFDPILNFERLPPRPFWYNDDKNAESLFDWLENRLTHTWVKVLKVCYIVLFFITIIFLK